MAIQGSRSLTAEAMQGPLGELLKLWKFPQLARDLAEGLANSDAFKLEKIAEPLIQIAVQLSGAEVGSLRFLAFDDYLHLVGEPVWTVPEFNTIPKFKHCGDCHPGDEFAEVVAWRRDRTLDAVAARRRRGDGSPLYTPDELGHFEALGSEAFIFLYTKEGKPKAVIVLGHRDANHFDPEVNPANISLLKLNYWLFNAFYMLADLVQDRVEKAKVLREIATSLPEIAGAPSLLAFARAVLTVLTCGQGFGFERALFFWMEGRELPAKCVCAVGGVDRNWPTQRIPIGQHYDNRPLAEFIQNAIRYPAPGTNPIDVPDPLFPLACGDDPLMFRQEDGGKIADMLANPHSDGHAVKLRNDDPWIARIRHERPGIFINESHKEYFAYPLLPLGDGKPRVMGFVICDLTFRPQPHLPGLGFPDLNMAGFVVNLIARFRQAAESHDLLLYMLAALPHLRHSAPDLLNVAENLTKLLQRVDVTDSDLKSRIQEQLEALTEAATGIGHARDLAEGHGQLKAENAVANLGAFLESFCEETQQRHPQLKCHFDASAHPGGASIKPESLSSILGCLANNAAQHGPINAGDEIALTLCVKVETVPEKLGKTSSRVVIYVEDNGRPIPEWFAKFIFCDRVSSSESDGHGTGLSSARLQAKAYGGDLLLDSANPVRFCLVLQPLGV